MTTKDKIIALIDAYIEIAQRENYDDSQIIDSLTDIFDRSELEEYGFRDFIKDYFDCNDEDCIDYAHIDYMTREKEFPVFGKNEHNENIIIDKGIRSGKRLYMITTSQNNGWIRLNTFFEDGSTEETYGR